MKKKIIELYITKDKKVASGWTQLIAVDEDGDKWMIAGSYCGGIPESHWGKLKEEPDMNCHTCGHWDSMHGDNGICYSCKPLGEKCKPK